MAYCPEECGDDTLIPNLPGECDLIPRKRQIKKIGFFPCGIALPSPLTCGALDALVAANTLTFSSELAEIEVADPTVEELVVADCRPTVQITTQRVINFQDRIPINVDNSALSPAEPNVWGYDYDFWQDKKTKQALLRYLIVYCDGSVVIAKDETGSPMTASLNVFLSYERQGTGGTSYTIEIKKGTLTFKGDPLSLANKPETDANGDLFNLDSCPL